MMCQILINFIKKTNTANVLVLVNHHKSYHSDLFIWPKIKKSEVMKV